MTRSELETREVVRELITEHLDKLISAAIENASGLNHLMARDLNTGKYERVASDTEDPEVAAAQIDAALKSGSCWLMKKDASVPAFAELMHRALGRPIEPVEITGPDGPIRISWLKEAQ